MPRVLTASEDKFVKGLNGGQEPPTISVAARDELDSWVADDPSLDEYLQRDPNTNLERMARVYNQERRRERRNAAHDGVDLMQICY